MRVWGPESDSGAGHGFHTPGLHQASDQSCLLKFPSPRQHLDLNSQEGGSWYHLSSPTPKPTHPPLMRKSSTPKLAAYSDSIVSKANLTRRGLILEKGWSEIIQKMRAHPSSKCKYLERRKCSGNISYYNLKQERPGSWRGGEPCWQGSTRPPTHIPANHSGRL